MSRYKSPTEAEVQAALLKIPTYQLRRAFYEGLRNPLWVQPLFEAGGFSNPPEPEETEDGYIRDIYWPEISYLVRVASQAPSDVVDVLLSLRSSSNAWVKRSVFEIGSKIPATDAARLKPLFEEWTASGFGWRSDPRDQVSCAIALLEGGETKLGRWLADQLFAPRPSRSDDPYRRKPVLVLDDYWYQTELPRLLPALGEDALKAVAGWLARYAEFSQAANGGHDFSGLFRPSIRPRRDSHESVEDTLVDAVRDLAVPAMGEDPEAAMALLLTSEVQLMRKITMFAVGESIREHVAAKSDASDLLPAARRLLSDAESDDTNLRIEYAELAQAVAAVDTDSLDVINGFVARKRAEDLKWIREKLDDARLGASEVNDQVTERADRYMHHLLSAVGTDALPPQLRAELVELDEQFGALTEAPTPNGTVTSWTGPNPFSSQDEMAAMSPTELAEHLASWHDTGDGWGPEPSHEGQGRELAGLLTTNPFALSGVGDLSQQLRPTYLRAILEGWEAALKADLELEWPQVARLIGSILLHGDESIFPVEGGNFDDDQDFRPAKKAAVGLLVELSKLATTSIPDDSFTELANLLIENADDEAAWIAYNEYEPSGSGWDPFTISLNWQWSERLRGLMYLATKPTHEPWKRSALLAVERELERQDKHGAGRAVLGENLARLFNDAPDWVLSHVDEFFGTRQGLSAEQQIALTTAIATHRYHVKLFELLSDSMIAAIDFDGEVASGWRTDTDPVAQIGEWAIHALIYGDKTSSDPLVERFFAKAPANTRGVSLGAISWSFFRAEKVDSLIRDRFAAVWDERLRHVKNHPEDHAEFKEFYWCAKGEKFGSEWWLPRLKAALQIEPSIAAERYMIGKELAQASSIDPATALEVLKLLLEGRDESGMVSFDLTRHAVPIVIANALSADDPRIRDAAEAFMNELGAKGNLQLEAEVREVLEGRVDADDIVD